MRIIKIQKENLQRVVKEAVEVLRAGGMVVYPTETCYGIGVDVSNQQTVDKLLRYKERREGKAISIAVSDEKMAEKYIILNETAKNLYRNFLPGPLTVVSKSRGRVASGLEAEDGTLGVRIPDYPLIIEIIKKLGKPITATSANASFKKTPYYPVDILKNTTKKQQGLIDLILDAGILPRNPPSTVVDTTLNELNILREGKIDLTRVALAKQGLPLRNLRKEISYSEEETKKIAQKLTKRLLIKLKDFCIIFALQGELGVGKTQFTKGVAKALGIKENIVSPTFVLVREYRFKASSGTDFSGSVKRLLKKKLSGSLKQTRAVEFCEEREVGKSVVNPTKISRALFSKNFRGLNSLRLQNGSSRRLKGILYHIDTWRMREGKELLDLGFSKMLKPGNVIIVEWLQKVKEILQEVERRQEVKVVWLIMEFRNKKEREIKYFLN